MQIEHIFHIEILIHILVILEVIGASTMMGIVIMIEIQERFFENLDHMCMIAHDDRVYH